MYQVTVDGDVRTKFKTSQHTGWSLVGAFVVPAHDEDEDPLVHGHAYRSDVLLASSPLRAA